MKKILVMLSVMLFLISTSSVLAEKGGNDGEFSLPEQAKANEKVYLGKAVDPGSGKMVEGYAFIKRVDGFAKPEGVGKPKAPKIDSCYEYLSRGAKWKVEEPFLVNANNNDGLSSVDVLGVLNAGLNKWEAAAQKQILGEGSLTDSELAADELSPDDKNEVYFGSIDDPGVIGVTIVWGVFGGPPSGRELVEWDQVYNQVDYEWSLTNEVNKMNFDNIATHELGHTVGLGDLYTSDCIDQTMYGYADYNEDNKTTLEAGDIKGVFSLYK